MLILNYFIVKFLKKFLFGLASCGGRNFLGRICIRNRGSGNKCRFRYIDRFRRINCFGLLFKILKYREISGFFGLVVYENGFTGLVLLSEGLDVGLSLYSGIDHYNNKVGYSNILLHLNLFSILHSIELRPRKGFQLARSAGAYATLIGKDSLNKNAILKLRSGWQVSVSCLCNSSIGFVSNIYHDIKIYGKAGKVRALGFRPKVRGVIMNPCDHPHGGGEGRGSPPRAQVTPWGFLTKGTPTKNKKKDRVKRRFFKNF